MNNNTEINDDDLKGAPRLSKVGGNNPFKASEDYFEGFSAKLQNRIADLEEIKNEAPVLSNIPKYNPFEVSAGYFDELPTIVQERCIDDKAGVSFMDWLLMLIKPRFAIPVLTTLFIAFAGITYLNKNADLPLNAVAEELSLDDQLQTIDEAVIVELLTADATIEKEKSNEERSIEDYLLDNNIDETNLDNEL